MTRHADRAFLLDMLLHSKEAIELTRGVSEADFRNSRVLQLAVARLTEIVGEAASKVTGEERTRYPEIPWQQIIGMRNRMVHAYSKVDLAVLWQTVVEDMPYLVGHLEPLFPEDSSS